MSLQIKRLSADDAVSFRDIRLEGLEKHPEAFGASWEDESKRPLDAFAERLEKNAIFGAFQNDCLVGVAGFLVQPTNKSSHKGMLWGMYVREDARGIGAASRLVDYILEYAKTRVSQVHLAVVSTNHDAYRLYKRKGFETYGTEPNAICVNGISYDEFLMVKLFSAPVSNIQIRELCADDVLAISSIDGGAAWHGEQDRWSNCWAEHSQGLRVCTVAIINDCIAGYGSLVWKSKYSPFAANDIPEIHDMVVAESYRGRGIATAMIADLEDRARAAGKSVIGIGVGLYADYGSAQRLYSRLGYALDGKGITWNNQPAVPMAQVVVDDELIIWMSKALP